MGYASVDTLQSVISIDLSTLTDLASNIAWICYKSIITATKKQNLNKKKSIFSLINVNVIVHEIKFNLFVIIL